MLIPSVVHSYQHSSLPLVDVLMDSLGRQRRRRRRRRKQNNHTVMQAALLLLMSYTTTTTWLLGLLSFFPLATAAPLPLTGVEPISAEQPTVPTLTTVTTTSIALDSRPLESTGHVSASLPAQQVPPSIPTTLEQHRADTTLSTTAAAGDSSSSKSSTLIQAGSNPVNPASTTTSSIQVLGQVAVTTTAPSLSTLLNLPATAETTTLPGSVSILIETTALDSSATLATGVVVVPIATTTSSEGQTHIHDPTAATTGIPSLPKMSGPPPPSPPPVVQRSTTSQDSHQPTTTTTAGTTPITSKPTVGSSNTTSVTTSSQQGPLKQSIPTSTTADTTTTPGVDIPDPTLPTPITPSTKPDGDGHDHPLPSTPATTSSTTSRSDSQPGETLLPSSTVVATAPTHGANSSSHSENHEQPHTSTLSISLSQATSTVGIVATTTVSSTKVSLSFPSVNPVVEEPIQETPFIQMKVRSSVFTPNPKSGNNGPGMNVTSGSTQGGSYPDANSGQLNGGSDEGEGVGQGTHPLTIVIAGCACAFILVVGSVVPYIQRHRRTNTRSLSSSDHSPFRGYSNAHPLFASQLSASNQPAAGGHTAADLNGGKPIYAFLPGLVSKPTRALKALKPRPGKSLVRKLNHPFKLLASRRGAHHSAHQGLPTIIVAPPPLTAINLGHETSSTSLFCLDPLPGDRLDLAAPVAYEGANLFIPLKDAVAVLPDSNRLQEYEFSLDEELASFDMDESSSINGSFMGRGISVSSRGSLLGEILPKDPSHSRSRQLSITKDAGKHPFSQIEPAVVTVTRSSSVSTAQSSVGWYRGSTDTLATMESLSRYLD
ncbi:hypothetical protein BASA83_010738 [Batrachochytrium salamandrivorans]|nr:hypothetical protein BASA81_014178 [Batrachochytrium salamandrivorans]KAH9266260.1 hypothetical protein BASA83_010738 [Batrachochytrium salamandrivorans]